MTSSLLLLALGCAFGQSAPAGTEWVLAPRLAAGVELVYSGTCSEESLLPGVQYQRTYRIDNHLLVLAADDQAHDVAIMTTISSRDPGEEPKYTPVSVKLELAQVNTQGRLKSDANLQTPITLMPLIETGCFLELPATRVGANSVWEVAEAGRPPRSWTVLGVESTGGLTCVKLMGQQQSEDWDRPRADRAAWRRRELVWLSMQMGVAVKVERTLERRDPGRRDPSHKTVTHYTLESRLKYPGKLFDDRKREVLQAKRFGDDAGPMIRQPAEHSRELDALLRKVSHHLDNAPTTPYRKAVIHLAHRVDSARKGELLLAEFTPEEPPAPIGPLRVGQKVPDSVLNELTTGKTVRLNRLLGRPTLVMYYSPHTKTGVEVLNFASELVGKVGDKVGIVAMAVTNEPVQAVRQHAERRLPFAIFDGAAMRIALSVDATPRFVVLDGDGVIRYAITGWSPPIGEELIGELTRK